MIVDLKSCGVSPCATSVWLEVLIYAYISSTSYTRIHSMCPSDCIWMINSNQRQTLWSVVSSLDLLLSSIIPLSNRFCVGFLFPVCPGLALVLFLLHRVILLLFLRCLFAYFSSTSLFFLFLPVILFEFSTISTLSFMFRRFQTRLISYFLTWGNIFFLLLLSPSDTEN